MVSSGFGTYGVNSPVGSIVANTRQHVAMVYNDTTLKLYIGGVEVASTNIRLKVVYNRIGTII